MVRVFANGSGDRGTIPGRVITKTQKMVLESSLFNTQHYKVWIKDKWSTLEKGVAPFRILWYCSYWKRSLRVALENRRPTFLSKFLSYSLDLQLIIVVKLVTFCRGWLAAFFSLATIPRSKGGRYSVPWIAPVFPWSLPYNCECKARQHQVPFFESLVWLDLGLVNTLLVRTTYSCRNFLD